MLKQGCLSLKEVIMIASMTAEKNQLKMPNKSEIMKNFNSGKMKRLPVMIRCEKGTMWVDRYYAAYQLGYGDVHYTYLTREHIKEEVDSYGEANAKLPADIRHCFITGMADMKKHRTRIWVETELAASIKLEC